VPQISGPTRRDRDGNHRGRDHRCDHGDSMTEAAVVVTETRALQQSLW